MNIFFLASCPKRAATMQCDKHVVKMVLETAQLLSTAKRLHDGVLAPVKRRTKTGTQIVQRHILPEFGEYPNMWMDARCPVYWETHQNHPSAVWARQSTGNYRWLHAHLVALGGEYASRYGRVHKTIENSSEALSRCPRAMPYGTMVEPPQCMPDSCKNDSTVVAYLVYYNQKADEWAERGAPMKWRGISYE